VIQSPAQLATWSTILNLPVAIIATVAAIASVVIAYLALNAPSPSAPAPHSLPDPCAPPTAATLAQFHLDPKPFQPQGGPASALRSCDWTPPHDATMVNQPVLVLTINYVNQPPSAGNGIPYAVPKVKNAQALQNDLGVGSGAVCLISWPVSFGTIMVSASTNPGYQSQLDPCGQTKDMIEALLPDLPG
jgi:hypothetical protein